MSDDFTHILNWVSKNQTTQGAKQVQKLPGDASTRQYFRVTGSAEASWIVMKMEPFSSGNDSTPFLKVQEHLQSAGIDVPEVLAQDPGQGLLLLEDLGDVTLLKKLQSVTNQDVERHLYERVIDELVLLQWEASPKIRPAPLEAFGLKFDLEKLMWEVRFTVEHFYLTHLKREMGQKDKDLIEKTFIQICEFLANEPTVLTHRDFHSRNVMVKPDSGALDGERFVMIDFQDARMGPAQYDLASLLKDSYYQLEEAQIERLLNYYIARWEALSEERLDRAHFFHVFDLMSVQRNFKAIGSFASFLNRRGNPTYLKFIGNTFENIRRTLLKYPAYSDLREVLFHYYYF